MTLLKEVWNRASNTTYATRKASVRTIIASNLQHGHRQTRAYHPSIANNILMRELGKSINQAITDEDSDELIDHLNTLKSRCSLRFTWQTLEKITDRWHEVVGYTLDLQECDDCGAIHHTENGYFSEYHDDHHCESCHDNYRYSEYLSDYIHEDSAYTLYRTARQYRNGDCDYITEEAGSSHFAEHPNDSGVYLSSEAWEQAVDEGDIDPDEDEFDGEEDYTPTSREDQIIGDYHSSRRILSHIPSPKYSHMTPRILMGLELEVEIDNRSDQERTQLAKRVQELLNTDPAYRYCACERDGSISNGFEIVTGYTGLDIHEQRLKALADMPFVKQLQSHDTTTCGLHVHIDKGDMTVFHASKLMLFMHAPSNERLIKAVARRYGYGSGFAKFKNKATDDGATGENRVLTQARRIMNTDTYRTRRTEYRHSALRQLNSDRYEAINFQPERTVEYRIYRGSLKYETIMACLEFTWLTYNFTKFASLHELTTPAFLHYIRHPSQAYESRYLRQLLVGKGLLDKDAIVPLDAEHAPKDKHDFAFV